MTCVYLNSWPFCRLHIKLASKLGVRVSDTETCQFKIKFCFCHVTRVSNRHQQATTRQRELGEHARRSDALWSLNKIFAQLCFATNRLRLQMLIWFISPSIDWWFEILFHPQISWVLAMHPLHVAYTQCCNVAYTQCVTWQVCNYMSFGISPIVARQQIWFVNAKTQWFT